MTRLTNTWIKDVSYVLPISTVAGAAGRDD
jgi:hypothetical protein